MIEINPLKIKIKYHADIDRIEKYLVGDWIDLRTAERVHMEPGDFRMISLGVSMELPYGYEAHIIPRSSTYNRYGIRLANSMGMIDNSYRGDNDIWHFPAIADRSVTIEKNTRICQFRIMPVQPMVVFEEVEHLGNADRRGFGSTGVN